MTQNSKKPTLEAGIKRLEEIVEQLESGSLTMDASLKLYEEGVDLTQFCAKQLNAAEAKIKLLSKQENGFELIETDL